MARYISNIRGKTKQQTETCTNDHSYRKIELLETQTIGEAWTNLGIWRNYQKLQPRVSKYRSQVEGQRERERDMTWQTFITTFVGGIRPCQCLARLIAGCTRVYYIQYTSLAGSYTLHSGLLEYTYTVKLTVSCHLSVYFVVNNLYNVPISWRGNTPRTRGSIPGRPSENSVNEEVMVQAEGGGGGIIPKGWF